MTTSINTILKNRKNRKNKKGFSLVELIVVLVIMAILAAALVPTLIGYINQTRQSNAKNEAASAVQAAQTIFSNAYASPNMTYTFTSKSGSTITAKFTGGGDSNYTTDSSYTSYVADIKELAEVPGTVSNVTISKIGQVTGLTYAATNGETVTFLNGKYTVS